MKNSALILNLFDEQMINTDEMDVHTILSEKGGIDPLEGMLLYLTILKTKPQLAIEFSPQKGYSSMCIGMGLRQLAKINGYKKCPELYTFEINKKYKDNLDTMILQHNLFNVNVIFGDALEEIPSVLAGLSIKPDLCFIDSDHRAEFARRYIKEIFPLLNPGCQVVVHDLCASKLSENNSCVDFKTSLLNQGNASHCSGEEKPLYDYLAHVDYSVLHAITGGNHEGAKLPVNEEFYEDIQSFTGIDFKSNRICPKSVWFNV